MCQVRYRVREVFDEHEVVLCCDDHLEEGFHFDRFNNLVWKVPGTAIPAKMLEPLHELQAAAVLQAA